MRYFELLLYALTFVALIYNERKGAKSNIGKLYSVIGLLLLIGHSYWEGLRWQMIFVYILVCISLVITIVRAIKDKNQVQVPITKVDKPMVKVIRTIVYSICILFMMITGFLLWFFPINSMPIPTGPYGIGTITYELTDNNRMEIYGDQPGTPRKIRFQVWYPADDVEAGQLTKWMNDGKTTTSGVPNMYGLPLWVLNHTALINSHSYSDVPISANESKYPVVVISHGWTGFMELHSDIAEMLASHGYIVVSINHTYGAAVSTFNDGEVIYADFNALPDRDSVTDFDQYSHPLVNTYALDDQLVLDYLENYPVETGVLENRIDMDRIGMLGHSTGGGGVVQTAIQDDRVKAVLGLDAWVEPIDSAILEKGLSVPSLFLRSQQWEVGPNNQYLESLVGTSLVEPMVYQIQGGNHIDFTMLYMYNPITNLFGFSGSLDNLENATIQRDYILTFFDQILLGESAPIETMDVTRLYEKYDAVDIVSEYLVK